MNERTHVQDGEYAPGVMADVPCWGHGQGHGMGCWAQAVDFALGCFAQMGWNLASITAGVRAALAGARGGNLFSGDVWGGYSETPRPF